MANTLGVGGVLLTLFGLISATAQSAKTASQGKLFAVAGVLCVMLAMFLKLRGDDE